MTNDPDDLVPSDADQQVDQPPMWKSAPDNSSLANMAVLIQQLQADFRSKIMYDQSKDRVIDTLHKELQQHREDLVFKILQPLINDLIQLYDDMNAVTAQEIGDESGDRVRLQMRSFLDDIETVLQHYGFDLYQSDEATYDRKLHRISRVESTHDPALDLTVLERKRRGVRYGDRIIRPESVVIAQYKPPVDISVNSE
jgi:molecular chaperone GrpE